MEAVIFDPNLNYCGSMSNKTVKLTFGLWDFRFETTVIVGGNVAGFDCIEAAIGSVYADLPDDDFGDARLLLTNAGGDTCETVDDAKQGEDWLQDMLISAAIIDIQPQKAGAK